MPSSGPSNEKVNFDAIIKNLEPRSSSDYLIRGSAYWVKRDFVNAIIDLERSIKLDPSHPGPYNVLGHVFREKGQLDRALAEYNDAIQRNSQFDDAYHHRGLVYGMKCEYDKGIADFTKAIEYSSDRKRAGSYFFRGLCYYKIGESDSSKKDYAAAVKLDPEFANKSYADY